MTTPIMEVVLYQIKAEKVTDYQAISQMANQFIHQQKGFLSRKVLQDHKDSTLFIDIVAWETYEDGINATQKLQKEATMTPFFEAIEKVISFSHYDSFE